MASIVMKNVETSRKAFVDRNEKRVKEVFETEDLVNRFEKELTSYLIHIEASTLSDHQQLQQRHLLYVVSDLEHISDRCKNLAELSEQMMREDNNFSIGGYEDLENMCNQSLCTLKTAINYWKDPKQDELYDQAVKSEELVNEMETQLRDKHIRRLSQRKCKVESGVIFLDAISNLERISDYAMHIAEYAREEAALS